MRFRSNRPEKTTAPSSALYLVGGSYDERRLEKERASQYVRGGWSAREAENYVERERNTRMRLAQESGYADLVVRKIGQFLLVRPVEQPREDEAFFVLTSDVPEGLQEFKPSHFQAALKEDRVGRCLLYQDPIMNPTQYLLMGFRPKGAGIAMESWVQTPFEWDIDLLPEGAELLTMDAEALRRLCMPLFRDVINAKLPDPYVFQTEFEDIPLVWEQGSEAELRALTHAICCTEPGLFDAQEPVVVNFQAALPSRRGGLRTAAIGWKSIISRRMMSLCDLAFRLNRFRGATWCFRKEDLNSRRGPENRRSGCHLARERLHITVAPPSAQERAEAFLTLIEWLEDKLHDPEKRARLIPHWEDLA